MLIGPHIARVHSSITEVYSSDAGIEIDLACKKKGSPCVHAMLIALHIAEIHSCNAERYSSGVKIETNLR